MELIRTSVICCALARAWGALAAAWRSSALCRGLTAFFDDILLRWASGSVICRWFSKDGWMGPAWRTSLFGRLVTWVANLIPSILHWIYRRAKGLFDGSLFCRLTYAIGDQTAVLTSWVVLAILVGTIFAAITGVIVGVPVLRLRGDYLAIVTLAFGEIIRDIINCLLVGWDENGLHFAFNFDGTKNIADLKLSESGIEIVKGAQGATGNDRIATFAVGFVLVMITLVVVLNLVRSRTGRAVMAIRDNRIAAESVGINITKYKLMAFTVSAALAGAAGTLFAMNYTTLVANKFDFNTSILILVFVVLGGLGNMLGSIIAATALTILPEALREFSDYRMLVYAIVLILVMLATNNPQVRTLISRIIPRRKGAALDE